MKSIAKNEKRHVEWDEQKLKETEKFRGQFQKIDEPKTPYRNNSDSDQQQNPARQKSQEQINIEENLQIAKQNSKLNSKKKINLMQLNQMLEKQLNNPNEKNLMESLMEDEQEEENRRKKEEFKKKRANHYNQYKLIQQVKNNNWQEDN